MRAAWAPPPARRAGGSGASGSRCCCASGCGRRCCVRCASRSCARDGARSAPRLACGGALRSGRVDRRRRIAWMRPNSLCRCPCGLRFVTRRSVTGRCRREARRSAPREVARSAAGPLGAIPNRRATNHSAANRPGRPSPRQGAPVWIRLRHGAGGARHRPLLVLTAKRDRTLPGADRLRTRRRPPRWAGVACEYPRQRPTLPEGLPPSTIGAGGLNGRVRNGNGCVPAAMATGKSRVSAGLRALHSEHERLRTRCMCDQALGRLVPVG